MNRIFQLTRRLWAALLALCLVLALTLPVFAEGAVSYTHLTLPTILRV